MPQYSDEEAREILRRAIDSHELERQGLTHEDLVDAAREMGIEAEAIERAAIEVRHQAEVDARRRTRRRREQQRFAGSVATYAVVNAFLVLLDWMTGPGWWVQWPLMIWGLFLALHLLRLVSPKQRQQRDERAERRWRRKAEREARRRARAEARRGRRHAEEDFERAVERGVAALLSAAAKSLDGLVSVGDRRPSDFQRYVDAQKHTEARPAAEQARPPPPGPRARVEGEPEPESELDYEHERGTDARRRRSREI